MRAGGWMAALMVASSMLGGSDPSAAAQTAPSEPGLFSTTLPNGMLVLVRERPTTEVAAISVGIRGGSRDEELATVGAAHFMEHMYFQGTPRRRDLAGYRPRDHLTWRLAQCLDRLGVD